METTHAATPRRRKTLRAFRFTPRTDEILTRTAQHLRRTKVSIIEQLVREFCTTKNLQPR